MSDLDIRKENSVCTILLRTFAVKRSRESVVSSEGFCFCWFYFVLLF